MNNAYEQIRLFYEEEMTWEPVIKREWVEGFFRYKAWQGASDDDLRDIWQQLCKFEMYLSFFGNEQLDEISLQEYSLAVEWMSENIEGFHRSISFVRHFFDVLVDFYTYISNKGEPADVSVVREAARLIAGGEKVKRLSSDVGAAAKTGIDSSSLPGPLPNLAEANEIMQSLMDKVTNYYSASDFNDDIHRAMYFFAGNEDLVESTEDHSAFWIGFWDFFLFDYHLLLDDKNPMHHFLHTMKAKLSAGEQNLLKTIMSAKFTVFYIVGTAQEGWVECRDIFTKQDFYLPRPDGDYRTLKRMLYTGHILYGEITLVNNLTSVEISPRLRQRIYDELVRQKRLFEIKQPDASWQEFFNRHAINVRHTVDMLTKYARLNVLPLGPLDRKYPEAEVAVAITDNNENIAILLGATMANLGFSAYDIKLARKMWRDFCCLSEVRVHNPLNWILAVLTLFSAANSLKGLPVAELAAQCGAKAGTVYQNRARLKQVLQVEKFDPRYINEEGFICMLLTSF